jgi:nuclear transport factor 2 (NTF2) superfamily protein|tara:strand:+ start:2631 stop:2885 length:255 start_codon:yes stop_codon:yes gene_type:complete
MQIGNVTNQYINTYVNDGTQVANQEYVRKQERVQEYNQAQWQREQQKRMYQWMAYIMMMQFFAKNNMWNLLNDMRIQRTLDIMA